MARRAGRTDLINHYHILIVKYRNYNVSRQFSPGMSLYDYETYEEARENFDWAEKWSLFDGDRENFNIASECIDRHNDKDVALNVKYRSGKNESYARGELRQKSSQFAHWLEAEGISKGDRVAIMLQPTVEFFIALYGIWKRGAVTVPIHILSERDTIEHKVEDSDPELIISNSEQLSRNMLQQTGADLVDKSRLSSLIDGFGTSYNTSTAAEDSALIMYTSGTTGMPKGYTMPHKMFVNYAPVGVFGHGVVPEDTVFCPTQPAFMMGLLNGATVPLYLGATAGTYVGKFDSETVLAGLEEFKATNLISVATALRRLANSGYLSEFDLDLERISSGGEMLDEETMRKFKKETGVLITNGYGTSEHGTIISNYALFDNWTTKIGSLGKPFPGIEAAILDDSGNKLPADQVGEIAYRIGGDGQWIRTSDAGKYDEEGYYWHKGRVDDVIITSGYRIGPHEVEDALMGHPAVDEAAAIPSPDDERGNIVKAFIIANTECSEELKPEIKDHVRSNLSKYAYPREIQFVEELPRTSNGKIKRKSLRKREQRQG